MTRYWVKTSLTGALFLIVLMFVMKVSTSNAYAAANKTIQGDISNSTDCPQPPSSSNCHAITDNEDSYYDIWDSLGTGGETIEVDVYYTCTSGGVGFDASTSGGNGLTSRLNSNICASEPAGYSPSSPVTMYFKMNSPCATTESGQYCHAILDMHAEDPLGDGGHFSYTLVIRQGNNPSISYAAQQNPGNTIGSSWPPGGSDSQFGVFADSQTINFQPPCGFGSHNVEVAWSGADYGAPYQNSGIQFTLTDNGNPVTLSNGKFINNPISKDALGDYPSSAVFSIEFQAVAGHHYQWAWTSESPYNEIVYSIPFTSNSFDYGVQCSSKQPTNPSPTTKAQCSTLSVTDPGGYTTGSGKTAVTHKTNTLVNSSNAAPSINASNPSNNGASWNGDSGSVSGIVSNGSTNKFNYLPTGANSVTITTRTIYYDSSANKWYKVPGSDTSTTAGPPCYSAECNIYQVVGNLPDGYTSPGGTVTVYAEVWNDSSIVEYSGDPAAHAQLQLQNNGGDFGFAAPVAGSSYLNTPTNGGQWTPSNAGWWQPISFQTTAPTTGTSGTIVAQMAYAGEFFMGSSCSYTVNFYPPPLINVDNAICGSSSPTLNGWAFARNGQEGQSINVDVYVDGPAGTGTYMGRFLANGSRPDVDAAYGIPGNHGFSIPIPTSYQDGQNHTFYAYAIDPSGIENGGPSTYAMTGCESFDLQPGANGGALSPTIEYPSSFDGSATVTVTYGPNNNSWYGPDLNGSNQNKVPGFPGVPASVPYTLTKNGTVLSSGSVPSPTSNSRFNDTTYTPTALTIAPGTYQAGDTYCINVSADPIDGYIQNDGTVLSVTNGGPDTQSSCDTVKNRPYFKAYNSDVSAGGNFKSIDSTCGGGGTLAGWNNDSGTNPSYDFGSGAQFSALALGNIVGFASAQQTGVDRSRAPTTLSFANTANNSGSGTDGSSYSPYLGGKLGSSNCLSDATAPADAAALDTGGVTPYTLGISGLSSGGQTIGTAANPVNVDLTGGSVAPGTDTSLFVNGNVYISGNIVYGGSNWNLSNVPSFALHATGNIYIDPSVTELEGMYIAKATSSGGGTIYTCGTSSYAPVAAKVLYGTCNKQLTVYGSFSANQVNLMRTFGSLRDARPVAGESAVSVTKNGTDYSSCGPYAPGAYPCSADGTSVYALQEYKSTYSLTIPAGTGYKLDLNYGNYQGNWPPPAGLSPPYTYDVEVDVNGAQVGSDLHLSAAGSSKTVNLGTLPANPSITITWKNNYYGSDIGFVPWNGNTYAYDPNFEIHSLTVSSPATPTTPASITSAASCSNSGGGWMSLALGTGYNTCAAEVFYLDPSLYLSNPAIEPPSNGAPQADSITSLPPVL